MGDLARMISRMVAWTMDKNPVNVKFVDGVEDDPVR